MRKNIDFDKWYWSYGYGSKALCIKMIQRSSLSEEDKKIRIASHEKNFGVTKNFG